MSEPIAKALIPCLYFTQDKAGRYSLINVFDSFHQAVPAQIGFFLYALIANPPASGEAVIQVEDQLGMVLWTSGLIPFVLSDQDTPWMSDCKRIGPFSVRSHGSYRIVVIVGRDRVGEVEFRVRPECTTP